MRALIAALQFLTRLPLGRVRTSEADFVAAVRWFPAAGLCVGAVVAGAAMLGARIEPWTGALFALVAWVAITGALHLDGLGDLADAAGAIHKGRERLLAVLADPHVGSFGVVAIGLQLIAKLVLLHAAVERSAWLALLLIPFAARIGPLVWTLVLSPLHAGLGARFRAGLRPVHLLPWAVLLAIAAVRVPALAITPLLIAGWGWWLRVRIGGISGDGHGAGIEIVETGLLVAALVVPRWA